MADEIPYQQAGQVRQLLAEREVAMAYGQTSRVDAANKQLAALGYTDPKPPKADPEPEKTPPQGRQGRPRQTTAKVEE